ncbi:hypothetical protein JCM10207_006758 [Rhodosporidiobolus poonsookiae]
MPPFAATRPVNPPGASPVISEQQLWAGLGIKIREPKEFVPVITECRVVLDEDGKVVRIVRFEDGPEMREEVSTFEPTMAYFEMYPASSHPAGTSPSSPSSAPVPPPVARITNLISYGPPPANDLLLTFTFSKLPQVSEEDAVKMSREELNAMVGKGVEGSIEVVRRMVKEGKL